MKKIALTSLLAVCAASGAQAGNVINGNPLYMPQGGHFVSETSLSSQTYNVDEVTLAEKFGYGITDDLMVSVHTDATEAFWFHNVPEDVAQREYFGVGNSWNNIGLGLEYRLMNQENWKADVYGAFNMGQVSYGNGMMAERVGAVWGDHARFLDKDNTFYTWTAGARFGYTNADYTLSAHAALIYMNTEAFNWGNDEEMGDFNHVMNIGFAGHWVMSDTWSFLASADYYKLMDQYSKTDGWWDLTLGLNMNIDETKYVGAYLTKTMWRVGTELDVDDQEGYQFGMKFGIDF